MLVPADSVAAWDRAGIKFLGFHPLGAMGNLHLGAGAAPLPGRPGSALPSSPVSLRNASRKSEPGIHSQHRTGARPISRLF